MSNVAVAPLSVPLHLIDVAGNVRELDDGHVQALAASIALRGLIVPLAVRPNGERFALIAGHHRLAACRKLGWDAVEVTLREQEGSSADSAAENVVRKQLTPLEEARAVQQMLDEGFTLDGAAEILGWNRKLVSSRAKILELPETAQALIGSGELPLSALSLLVKLARVSPALCELTVAQVAAGELSGEQLAGNPGWAIGQALRTGGSDVFAGFMATLGEREILELRLGSRTEAVYAQAKELHKRLDRHSYGPPTIRFSDLELDQARAAGVLIDFDFGTPVITDKALFRELAKQAIARTLEELQAAESERAAERTLTRAAGRPERSPRQELESEHRATVRELTARAHGTNLDLGAALLRELASVDPTDIDVARFFALGLLGPGADGYAGGADQRVATVAANGIRLVIEEHRTNTTAKLKNGEPGRSRVEYGESEDAVAWLWKFIDGAGSAGELYGRVLVAFAAQSYACDLVLPTAKRRGPVLPRSRKEAAVKAFERLTKPVLPATHVQLRRALDREDRAYTKRLAELDTTRRPSGEGSPA